MTSRTPGSNEPRRSPNPSAQAPGSRSPAQRSPKASPKSVLSNVRSPQPPAGGHSPRSSFKGDIFAGVSDAPGAQDLAKSYSAEEDLKIYELFKSKPEGTQANQEPFNSQRKALETELGRTHESLRDRYKKYLKYLTDADVRNIKAQSKKGEANYLQFEKDADDKDKNKKKFKSVIHNDPRPVIPTRRHKGDGPKKNRMPKSMVDEAFDREGKGSIFPGRYRGNRSSMRMLSEFEEEKGEEYGARSFKRSSAGDEGKPTPRKRYIHRNQPLFDVRDFIPREYVQDTHVTKLDKIDVTPAVHSETYNLNEGLLSFPDVVQIGYDGGDFSFEFVKKPAIKDLMGVLASICQLMNVPAEEAQRIYEGVSLDLDDLKAYIGGHRKLVWTSLEDEALINALNDTKAFQRFYPILVGEKGEESVQKRINYLREKKMAKASPKAQAQAQA